MDFGILSLIPPVLALLLVIVTRKVLLSLGVGILVGAFMLNHGSDNVILDTITQITGIIGSIFIDDGWVNTWYFYILLFLVLLGMIAALISLTGGSRAFGDWALSRVKTRTGAQFVSACIGILIFIDDYFSSLTAGNVSRPFSDRHNVSRAKLAYTVDSTAAAMCVLVPLSSWGAYIITIIAEILADTTTNYSAFQAFMMIAPMNFYALFAILMVFAVAYFKLDIGPMRKHELHAIQTGELVDTAKGPVPGDSSETEPLVQGRVSDLLWPIATLVAATVFFMIVTGIQGTEGQATLLAIFENTDVAGALLYGGLTALVVTVALAFNRRLTGKDVGVGLWAGTKSMLPAIYILIFAWTIGDIIGEIGTGDYLAHIIEESSMNIAYLPVILFAFAGFMAFSTGTSWGTFGIMLPIAGTIAIGTDVTLLLPMLAAVLAGSIFGDHCSPISDTTILSSTGAGSHHIDHVLTQLPYALIIGAIASVGFLVLGFTGNVLVALVATLGAFTLAIVGLRVVVNRFYGGVVEK
ncbi:MAG: Na+/H+ antiporter NhaC family protein [Bacillus sp. (in: Bacteria)]|nr:Na+/H+ antiporter NhaC family protein [Bacillus sp. (in: firmicutes)]